MNYEIFLASGSPRRRELIAELALPAICVPTEADESLTDNARPEDCALLISGRKALAAKELPESAGRIIISADTIVVLDGVIFGKPTDEADAVRMLRELSGRRHTVMTGVCVIMPDGRTASFCEQTEVDFFELSDRQIKAYAACGESLDKAGAYGIQGRGKLLIKGIHGDYYNVMGLPVARLARVVEALCADQ